MIKTKLKYLGSILSKSLDSFQEFLYHLPFTLEYLSPKYDSPNYVSLKPFTGILFKLNSISYSIHQQSHKFNNQDILSFVSLQCCKRIHLNILVSNVFSHKQTKSEQKWLPCNYIKHLLNIYVMKVSIHFLTTCFNLLIVLEKQICQFNIFQIFNISPNTSLLF